jgi:hypothetical protein
MSIPESENTNAEMPIFVAEMQKYYSKYEQCKKQPRFCISPPFCCIAK